jgi:hypothetical protein
MPIDREWMKVKAVELAAKGVLIGTSSWKDTTYPDGSSLGYVSDTDRNQLA